MVMCCGGGGGWCWLWKGSVLTANCAKAKGEACHQRSYDQQYSVRNYLTGRSTESLQTILLNWAFTNIKE